MLVYFHWFLWLEGYHIAKVFSLYRFCFSYLSSRLRCACFASTISLIKYLFPLGAPHPFYHSESQVRNRRERPKKPGTLVNRSREDIFHYFSFKTLPLSNSFGQQSYFAEKTWQKIIFQKVQSQANSSISCIETDDSIEWEPAFCYFRLPSGALIIKHITGHF